MFKHSAAFYKGRASAQALHAMTKKAEEEADKFEDEKEGQSEGKRQRGLEMLL